MAQKDYGKITNWINNEKAESTTPKYEDIYAPRTGATIGQVLLGTTDDLNLAVKSAKAAFPGWKNTHIKTRVQVMFKLKNLMEKNFSELTQLITLENGKTITEAEGDVSKAIEVLEFACALPNKISGNTQTVSTGITCSNYKEPLGVVASITPFNFPIMVPMWTVPIALTAGNTMILKPSRQVPISAIRLAELFKEAGLPAGVLNVVHGGSSVVTAICDHPDIKAVSFVGSTEVAHIVYERSAKANKKVLALGGAKNHLVLLPDANIETAPKQIIDSAIGCAGQRCMAAGVLVTVGDCSKHIEQMAAYAKSVTIGDNMGAIINKASVEKITNYITQAEKMGAKILCDGRNPAIKDPVLKNGNWVGPTLIDDATLAMPAVTEEIFGPVLPILHVKSLEEAMEIENANPYGNACSVFTTNGPSADYVMTKAEAGMCGVNVGVPVPREPFAFGGWHLSKFGNGDITGDSAMNFWTQDKKITVKWAEPGQRNWMS